MEVFELWEVELQSVYCSLLEDTLSMIIRVLSLNITMATSDFNTLYFRKFAVGDGVMVNGIGTRWKKYVLRFDNFLVALSITDEEQKIRALLLKFGGFELQDIHDFLEDSGETFDTLQTIFAKYLESRTNDSFEIFKYMK